MFDLLHQPLLRRYGHGMSLLRDLRGSSFGVLLLVFGCRMFGKAFLEIVKNEYLIGESIVHFKSFLIVFVT